MLARMWGKRHTHTLLVELQIGAAALESSVENPQKTWNGPTFDPVIPLLGLYPKDLKSAYYSNEATSMFIAAQFTLTSTFVFEMQQNYLLSSPPPTLIIYHHPLIKENIRSLVFWDWLISLSMIFSNSIHLFAYSEIISRR